MTNKRLLINATQSEELRAAIVEIDKKNLLDLIAERPSYKTKTGNIYLGKITSIEQSLNAAFVNFGSERHGFLPLKEIATEYFAQSDSKKSDRSNVKELIKEGTPVIVQVEKEERGNKGAALTTFISLAGSYLVLMPNNPRAGGISRRVEGEDRDELRDILNELSLPEEMGLIVRTAGVGKNLSELQWDLNALLKQWEAIKKASTERSPPFLIHQESDVVIRTIRDYLRQDVIEIVVDDAALYEKIKNHLEQIRPDFAHCLKLYTGNVPLFNRYQIEHQIESAHQRELSLPAGGSIVIDHTEALVAVDVNSRKATKGGDIEETAFNTNLEAAEEIARQLRLRDIGGLVVIDFIDMASTRHRREVENHLRNALKLDKARTQVGSISPRFGLLEMSRQRLRHSLGEATQVVCPRCAGWGTIRGVESLALSVVRMIEEDAVKPNTAQIQVQLPIDIATYVINEKRSSLLRIEKNLNVVIFIIPNPELESPHYLIKRLSKEEAGGIIGKTSSYELLTTKDSEQLYKKPAPTKPEEKPAVTSIFSTEIIAPGKKAATGLLKRFLSSLFGTEEAEKSNTQTSAAEITPKVSMPVEPDKHVRVEKKPAPQAPVSAEDKKIQKPKEISTSGEAKARTRRGSRGGRRRGGGGSGGAGGSAPTSGQPQPAAKPQKPAPTFNLEPIDVEPPPDHLPPFPSDLENYYKDSIRIKGAKIPPGQTTAEKPAEISIKVEPEPAAPAVEDLNKPTPFTPLPPEEGAEPVIIRPQSPKEKDEDEGKEQPPSQPKENESSEK